jgi:hypothetical protein
MLLCCADIDCGRGYGRQEQYLPEVGVQLFFESAIAISQLEGSTSAITIPQLLKEM